MNRKELIRWIDDRQKLIGRTLTNEGLSARVLDVIQAPMVICFKIQLDNPRKSDVNLFALLANTFEQQLGVAPIRVYPAAGYFVVEIPSPYPVTPHAELLLPYVEEDRICVGYDTDVSPVTVNLKRYPSVLWIAPPRSGKTSSVRSIVYSLLKKVNHTTEDISVLVCAEKLEFWRAFIGKRGVVSVYSDFSEMENIVEMISRELSKKAKQGDHFTPPLILIIDDLLRVLGQTTKLGEYIAEIASTGGSVGVYLFLITQSAGSKHGTGGIQVEDNISTRIIYRTSSKIAAARSTGEDSRGIEQLTNQQGDALLIVGSETTRIATGFVTDQDIATLPDDETSALSFLRNFQLQEKSKKDTIIVPIQLVDSTEQKNDSQSISLPRISPPRALTVAESTQLMTVVKHYQTIGQPLSKNYLMSQLFGGKNGTYKKYLEDALNG